MKTVPLRRIALINPPTPEFDALPDDALITFMPLETVWSDNRVDTSRRALKSTVATGYTRFRSGDVVVPKVSPTFEAGRSAVTNIEGVGAGTTELHVLRATADSDPRFLGYIARSKHFLEEGETAYEGVAGLRRVSSEFVADFRVPLTPLDEQRRIADFLDDQIYRIDAVITARGRQARLVADQLVAARQAVLDVLVARWGATRLRHLALRIEQGWSPQADSAPAAADAWGVVRAGCVNGGRFDETDNKALPTDVSPRTEYEIREGDLLMSRASGSLDLIGSVAVVPAGVRPRLLLCDKIYRIRLTAGWSPDLVAHALRSYENREAIRLGVSGAEGMANNLPSGVIRDLRVPAVPSGYQAQAVAELESAESSTRTRVALLDRSSALLREYKQSLITAAVAGHMDITTASGRSIPA